jgi:Septin
MRPLSCRFPGRCIYFLDPDGIIPPSAICPPAPILPRTHNDSVSQPDTEPVILEPPVSTNPLLRRPVLPQAEINVIRALSSRVNVLPVIARADTLTKDRLAAIKLAIRRDLAEAGIGFGIFDLDTYTPSNGDNEAFNGLSNGSASSPSSSSPTSPVTPSFLRHPYALIAPNYYSHSDGVNRPACRATSSCYNTRLVTPRLPTVPHTSLSEANLPAATAGVSLTCSTPTTLTSFPFDKRYSITCR